MSNHTRNAADADADEDNAATQVKSAEDRKAAAALASLDGAAAAGEDSKLVDQEAVSKAMKKLDMGGGGGASGGAAGSESSRTAEAAKKAASERKAAAAAAAAAYKKIKVDAADVALLVDELDLTKAKATDLLKQHEGDAVKALRAFVSAH